MKINNQTFFPLSLIVLGGLIFFGDGSKAFTFVYPYPVDKWQQVIGALTFIIGFVLYKRSVK